MHIFGRLGSLQDEVVKYYLYNSFFPDFLSAGDYAACVDCGNLVGMPVYDTAYGQLALTICSTGVKCRTGSQSSSHDALMVWVNGVYRQSIRPGTCF
jgi:hypothetical protein